MRYLTFLLFLTLYHTNFSQDKKSTFDQYPFQVVYAENAKQADGITIVGRYDYLNVDAEIRLDAGFIILIHYSQKLFEFKGDTVISISDLLKEIPDYFVLNPEERPDIFYFSKYRKNLNATGAVFICSSSNYEMENVPDCIHPEQEFTIKWKSENQNFKSTPAIILLKDIFDREVGREYVEVPYFTMRLANYELGKEGLAILEVVNANDPDISSAPIGIRTQCNFRFIPNLDSINNPIEALNAWYYLTSRNENREARIYRDLLNQKTNHPFYQNLVTTWARQ